MLAEGNTLFADRAIVLILSTFRDTDDPHPLTE